MKRSDGPTLFLPTVLCYLQLSSLRTALPTGQARIAVEGAAKKKKIARPVRPKKALIH